MLTATGAAANLDLRIAVTGLGVVSPLGIGAEPFWNQLIAADRPGEHGSAPATRTGRIEAFSGRVADFGVLPDAARKQLAKSLKVMNRETQLGVAAGLQAIADSGVGAAYASERVGVSFGAGNACVAPEDFRAGVQACADGAGELDVSQWGAKGMTEMAPLWLLRCLPNMAACHLAILADLRGPSNTITQRSLGVDLALAEACRILRGGDAEAMLVGGAGTTLDGLHRLHAVWARAEYGTAGPSADADSDTDHFPAEGAAAVVLEPLAAALRRGATIYGEVLTSVSVSSGRRRSSGTATDVTSLAAEEALRRCGLSWEDVGHLHLPGFDQGDGCSRACAGVAAICGPQGPGLPVVSGRNRWGDAGAGSGAIELVACLLALHRGELFASPPSTARNDGSALRLVTAAGEPAGSHCLKFNCLGDRQASCVALARKSA